MSVRVRNVKRNVYNGFLQRSIEILISFITRTFLIRMLGAEYTGVTGLFTSIFNVLNVAELGFSSAIAYELYKPLAEKNETAIKNLLAFYKKIYKIIGVIIIIGGTLVIPILPFLIKSGLPNDLNLYLVFVFQLIYTIIGYWFFAYKEVLISASQREDVIYKIDLCVVITQCVFQIFAVSVLKNYYYYILAMVFCALLRTCLIGYASKKMFPLLYSEGEIDVFVKNRIIKNVKGIAVGKINVVSRNAFDDMILSACTGLVAVTIYDNYYYIMRGVGYMTSIIKNSILASVGDSIVSESVQKNLRDFERFEYYYWWLSTLCSTVMMCVYQPFMRFWAGDELVASNGVMILFVLYFYISQMSHIRSAYANATGIWWKLRKISFAEMLCNLGLNFVLGFRFGMIGVLCATCITVLVFSVVFVTCVLFREYFKKSPFYIMMEYLGQGLIAILTMAIVYYFVLYKNYLYEHKFLFCLIVIFIPNSIIFIYSLARKKTRNYLRDLLLYLR